MIFVSLDILFQAHQQRQEKVCVVHCVAACCSVLRYGIKVICLS